MEGWFKFERSWLENGVITADGDHLRLWLQLNAMAVFEPQQAVFRGGAVTLQPGQLITGRKKLATLCGVQEDKVQRILKLFEQAELITQEMSARSRIITLNLHNCETAETQGAAAENDAFVHSTCTTDAQHLHNTCTTDAQHLHTYKECKNEKNERAKKTRASARKPPFDQSIFGSDASYDLSLFYTNAIGLRDCDKKRRAESRAAADDGAPAADR